MKLYEEIPALRVGKKVAEVKERIIKDFEIRLVINKSFSRRFYMSPSYLEEFTIGHLLGEGLINKKSEIKSIKIDNGIINVKVEGLNMKGEPVEGSGSRGGWGHKIGPVKRVDSDFSIKRGEVFEAFKRLVENAKLWRATGGAHVAGIASGDGFMAIEDVSRHVAVDKIIGAGVLKKIDFSKSFMVYSGRMPANMLIKIVRMGIPIIASNAAPTFSGYLVAKKSGLTMIGFVRGERFNIYTCPERIKI